MVLVLVWLTGSVVVVVLMDRGWMDSDGPHYCTVGLGSGSRLFAFFFISAVGFCDVAMLSMVSAEFYHTFGLEQCVVEFGCLYCGLVLINYCAKEVPTKLYPALPRYSDLKEPGAMFGILNFLLSHGLS